MNRHVKCRQDRLWSSATPLRLTALGVLAALALARTGAEAGSSPPSPLTVSYAATPIESLPGFSRTIPVDLNDSGIALCRAEQEPPGDVRGYLAAPTGELTDLGTLAGGTCRPLGLDDRGRVVGASTVDGVERPFLWQNGSMQELLLPEGFQSGEARDLLSGGLIGGTVSGPSGTRAVLWTDGAPAELPLLPPFPCTRLDGLAEGGYAVGTAYPGPGLEQRGRAVMWRDGGVADLGALPGYSYSQARAVNTSGDVICSSFEPPYPPFASFWRGGVHKHLHGLIGSDACDLDDEGVAVGNADRYQRLGAWGHFGRIWAGNSAGDLGYQVTGNVVPIRNAVAINRSWQILVEGGDPQRPVNSGNCMAMLLNPDHKPAPEQMALTLEPLDQPTTIGSLLRFRTKFTSERETLVKGASLGLRFPPGLRYHSAHSDAGVVFEPKTRTVRTAPADLRTGDGVELEMTLQVGAAGVFRLEASGSTTVPVVEVTRGHAFFITGEPLPDLAPGVQPLQVQVTRLPRRRFKVGISGSVRNEGTRDASGTEARLYLGAHPNLRESDRLLKKLRLHPLRSGINRTFTVSVRDRRSPEGKYVHLMLDSPGRVKESDESNNTASVQIPE